ncbi:MAG TPA: peptidoglycan recognition protein [Gaiellaceae bacterium]|jgi:N-acetylmuramoyl-L-alanine amidase
MIHATPTMTVREIPLHAARTLAGATPRFDMVAFHWRGTGGVRYRVRFSDGWSPWRTADADTVAVQRGWRIGNLDWVGTASALQTRVVGRVTRLRSYTVWSPPERLLARRLAIANAPPIIPRLSWGADESIRRHAPVYAPKLVVAFVHHTAGANNYTRAESAAIVRGIEIYHVEGNGWWDIGYNFLVDKYGQVFEGRYGGVDRNVLGAHTMGFNSGSVGVAVIGDYGSSRISPAAARSLEQLLAWRLDVAHLDPLSTLTYRSGGNPRFPAGIPVLLRAISGHRDAYFTDCPGNALYAQLPAIATAVAALGGPKIYAPLAAKVDETHTRFTARLSIAQPWTVTITNSSGLQVAQGKGTGTAVDWTWDATLAPPDSYAYTIATADARAATGSLGGTTALALDGVTASPAQVAPGDTLTVGYTLTTAAAVTANLVSSSGQVLAPLATVQKPAGSWTLTYSPVAATSNGAYAISLTATAGARVVTANAAFVVDDILTGLTVTPTNATFTLTRPAQLATAQVANGTQIVATPAVLATGGPQVIGWQQLPDGIYTLTLTVTDDVGTFSRTTSVVVDTTPPRVTVLSYKNLHFRVNEPATLTLVVGANRYSRTLKQPGATQFWLKTKPAAYTLLATDASGNTTTVNYPR